MKILGISAFYHDSAACLIEDGRILSAAQEERFTRKRHDAAFPDNAIKYCLDSNNLAKEDIDYVAFYDKPFVKFERIVETYLAHAPFGLRSFLKAIPLWIKKKLWIKDLIYDLMDYKGKIIFPEHHDSHAASAFFPSPFEEAAILTVDGVGEWATASYGLGSGNHIDMKAEIHFPHSLGLLYSAFTYFTGFRVNSGEYKVMGLAPYGEPKYKDAILSELIDLKEDGSFKINMKYFDYCSGLKMTHNRLNKLFGGPPRKPETKITQREMDLARSVQDVTEEVVLRMARHVKKETKAKYLCLAGGVALNCVANGKLIREKIFDRVWIQPAAGDAGGAVGAALFAYYQYLNKDRKSDNVNDVQEGSLLGPEYSDDEIEVFLKRLGAVYQKYESRQIPEKTAELIKDQNVIGWFQGRMEFGPRALGSRSILGDARSPKMQETMNLKIKFREGFRPFAPSVTREKCSDYFDIDTDSPYMLVTAPVKQNRLKPISEREKRLQGFDQLKVERSEIPAVTHVNYSARIQTVDKNVQPLYHRLIERVGEITGCPVIINTSFNVRGEPIVCTPRDAYVCFMRTNIDALVIGNFILHKKDQKPFRKDVDWRKQFELD